ncbi:ROK family protein [Yoonia sp. MH D7]
MIAAGVDLGGTKIETQIFDAQWQCVERRRVSTPTNYPALVSVLAEEVIWAKQHADMAVGIGAAGLVNPSTGAVLTANLCANGMPLPADVARAAGVEIVYMNDCRALVLSEAVFGAGRGYRVVAGLILGTGVGGGLAVDGILQSSGRGVGSEFGHMAAPAHLVAKHNLPILRCGCGQMGCIETLIAGPGLTGIAQVKLGRTMTPKEIAQNRIYDPAVQIVWDIWVSLVAELLNTISRVSDPDIFVVGGGLSKMPQVADALHEGLRDAQFAGFDVAKVVVAQGGETSGARGAAYNALQCKLIKDHG